MALREPRRSAQVIPARSGSWYTGEPQYRGGADGERYCVRPGGHPVLGATLDDGRVWQSNFHDYPLPLMTAMPVIDVHILPGTELA
jgi:hypothetical protein